jgi:histidinol-phosphate aminotransferase
VTVTGATPIAVPNRPDHGHDIDAMVAAVTARTRVMIVCTPNNPTGVTVSRAEFESLMAGVPDDLLVLLDEAYFEFISDPDRLDGMRLLARYPNLVVLRTFSKAWGLAGLRIGYAVGAAPILSAAASAAIALSVTAAAQAAALVTLDYERQILDQVAVIVDRRERLRAGLRALGWNVPHSEGNFLWLPTGARSGHVAEALAERGIVARALLPEGVRVSVGEEESVAKLLKAAADIVPDLPIEARGARLD